MNKTQILDNLKVVAKDLGKFPTHRDLVNLKLSKLRNVIINSKIPLATYAQELGFNNINKPKGYWDNEDNVVIELKTLCDKLGRFPTRKDFISEGKQSVYIGLNRHGKTIQWWQTKLGFVPKKKPIGYWTPETVRLELVELVKKIGYFPTQLVMRHVLKRTDITKAMDRLGISFHNIQIELGFQPKERPKKYWLVWENLKKDIEETIIDEKFPTLCMIASNLGLGAVRGIAHFGGIYKVAKRMGYEPPCFKETSDGHLVRSSYEYLFDEWLCKNNIEHNYEGLISINYKYQYDFKVGDKYIEIWGYGNNPKNKRSVKYNTKRAKKEKIYQELNLNLISIEEEVFKLPQKEMEQRFAELVLSDSISSCL